MALRSVSRQRRSLMSLGCLNTIVHRRHLARTTTMAFLPRRWISCVWSPRCGPLD